ncbi:MAG: glycosyltransferase family 2 protein [Planctomycetota bacterium]
MFSVVIPAHNEGAVIERTLRVLLEGAEPGELEVVVVANGCSDDTADRARAFGDPVRVIDTPEGGKPNALNLGDAEATAFPRLYSDADVRMDIRSARAAADRLRSGPELLLSPRMDVDLTDRPWTVRAYYRVWMDLPYAKHKIGGVFGMSAEGRGRFEDWPDVIADDTFASVQFAPDEQCVLQDASFLMVPPAALKHLVHIEVRRRAGSGELHQRYPELMAKRAAEQKSALRSKFTSPGLWPALAVYLYVKFAARLKSRLRRLSGKGKQWNRDESSRRG